MLDIEEMFVNVLQLSIVDRLVPQAYITAPAIPLFNAPSKHKRLEDILRSYHNHV